MKVRYLKCSLKFSIENMSDVERLYLRGPRINSKLRGKSSLEKSILAKRRNVQTACHNTRTKVNKSLQKSIQPRDIAVASVTLEHRGPNDMSSEYASRPKTNHGHKHNHTITGSFVPYYHHKSSMKELNRDTSGGKLSDAGNVSKPKTVQEWRRRNLRSQKAVGYFCLVL